MVNEAFSKYLEEREVCGPGTGSLEMSNMDFILTSADPSSSQSITKCFQLQSSFLSLLFPISIYLNKATIMSPAEFYFYTQPPYKLFFWC